MFVFFELNLSYQFSTYYELFQILRNEKIHFLVVLFFLMVFTELRFYVEEALQIKVLSTLSTKNIAPCLLSERKEIKLKIRKNYNIYQVPNLKKNTKCNS